MDENTVEETTEIAQQSKISAFKSRITREGVLFGGVVAGIIIAGGYAILKGNVLEDDGVTIESGDDYLTITESPTD